MANPPSSGNLTGVTGDTNKYNVSSLQYPIDLDVSEEYGGNKVVFFINVPANSALAQGKVSGSFGTQVTDLPKGARSGSATSQKLKAGVVNASGGRINSSMLNPYKRLTSVIALYMPNAVQNTYSVNWQDEDMSGLFAGINEIGGALAGKTGRQEPKTSEAGALPAMGRGMSAAAAALAHGLMRNDRFSYEQRALSVSPGNSKAEMLFKGVDFRTFQFNFEFTPKSPEEAQNVLNIIRMFRFHMLPEYLDESTYLYIYPSEFDVKYYVGDKENQYVEKQMTAVLTNMTINYTPNSQFVTFNPSKGIDRGMSTQINIALQFKEITVPTKETSPHDALGV